MRSNSALAFLLLLTAWGNVASGLQRPGSPIDQDPSDPVYRDLATESLTVYMKEHGLTLTQPHEVTEVTKVTTQVVSGIITRIDFNALLDFMPVTCHSEILERPWLNVKAYTVTCDYTNHDRKVRSIPGGQNVENVNDPLYIELAEESLNKYVVDHGLTQSHSVVQVKRATKQVVAGLIYRIEFDALLGSRPMTCNSEILEQAWMNVRDIKVNCVSQSPIVGGLVEKDVNDPVYIQLALKSLQKYKQEKGISQCDKLLRILKVTEQVVSGTLIRIDFEATLTYTGDVLCHSEIWQQPWLHKEEIKVNCVNKAY
ncbi:multicystatin-like [Maniola jurtina]|uniref:multicystatin-like n=1 Tax=Maniola jurtina TaxID=191418 RepID=UPI001E68B5A2|nr:multicystatin-like [Maniola jurtina]